MTRIDSAPMRTRPAVRTAILGVVLLLAACGSSAGFSPLRERQRLESARARWGAAAPASYSFTMQRECFCPNDGEVRIRVEDGVVVSVRPVGSDIELVGPGRDSYRPIPGLFDVVQEAIERPAFSVVAEYDEALGFPSHVFIDYMKNAVDEEYGFRVHGVTFP